MKTGRRKTMLGLTLLVLTAAAVALAASGSPDRTPRREVKLQRALDQLVAAGVPGALLLVREDGRTIRLASGYGTLEPKTRMRATDRFRVGSITKSFVAAVVLQLVGEGKLALDDTVERRLPGVVPHGERITVRQLLNHTSGLFDYGGDEEWLAAAYRDPMRDWTPREIVAVATSHDPHFARGAHWSYSNTNYYVLGLIVEATTGRSLETELRSRIFLPLRLRATSFDTGPRIAGPHAHGYFLKPLQDVTVGSPSVVWAAGALVSDADDLARFFRALLGGRVLPAQLLRTMETMIPTEASFSYGLGLQKMRMQCGAVWGHQGGMPGYSTEALNSKDGRRQVVLSVNATEVLTPSLKNFRSFNTPQPAVPALERLIETAYCG
jgi:D-alanyl-D-alanine carboxypeptidase